MKNISIIESTKIPMLNQLYEELFSGGKGLRARLVQDISHQLNLSHNEISLLSESVEGVHQSSILHDDVLDSSILRRNRLATWVKFSRNKAILAGDYLLAQVSFRISEYGNLDLLKLTSLTIKKMVQGEWLQNDQKGQETLETLEQLDQVHILKTASLFQWCLRAPFLCCDQKGSALQKLLDEIGQIFGQVFQRADDMMDFGFRNKENKNEFKDLKEGYLNFFGIYLKEKNDIKDVHTLRSCQNQDQLKRLIGEDQLNQQVKSFDQMNQELIRSCQMKLDQLSNFLSSHQKELVYTLKSWVHQLYFR